MIKCLICGRPPTGHSQQDMKDCLEQIDESRFALRKHALERGWTESLS